MDNTPMTVDDFIRTYRSEKMEHLRLGQAAFVLLSTRRPKLADEIVAFPHLDPFYVDANLPAFEAWLRENWNRQP